VEESGLYSEASDGTRGSWDAVVAREKALACSESGYMTHLGTFFTASSDGHRSTFAEALARDLVQAVDLFTVPGSAFVGTAAEVAEHAAAMGEVMASGVMMYELASGLQGTFEQLEAYEAREVARAARLGPLVRLGRCFEASDGSAGPWALAKKRECRLLNVTDLDDAGLAKLFATGFEKYKGLNGFTGTFEAVSAHLKASQEVVARGGALYECAEDNFKGTFEEVAAHEAELGMDVAAAKEHVGTYCEASDGFRGSFKEAMEHEMALVTQKVLL
jgi:hypothetical protein